MTLTIASAELSPAKTMMLPRPPWERSSDSQVPMRGDGAVAGCAVACDVTRKRIVASGAKRMTSSERGGVAQKVQLRGNPATIPSGPVKRRLAALLLHREH